MINILIAILLIVGIIWTAKKLYFATKIATHPELYPTQPEPKISKKEMAIILAHLDRWRSEGKISREEHEHITNVCLSDMQTDY